MISRLAHLCFAHTMPHRTPLALASAAFVMLVLGGNQVSAANSRCDGLYIVHIYLSHPNVCEGGWTKVEWDAQTAKIQRLIYYPRRPVLQPPIAASTRSALLQTPRPSPSRPLPLPCQRATGTWIMYFFLSIFLFFYFFTSISFSASPFVLFC